MIWKRACWWFMLTCIAIIIQFYFPGIDATIPLLIIALQQQRKIQLFVVSTLLIVIQEGMGTFAFGGIFILYTSAIVLYHFGKKVLQPRSLLFVILFSIALSFFHYMFFIIMGELQDIPYNEIQLGTECVFQSIFTPVFWWILYQFKGIEFYGRIKQKR